MPFHGTLAERDGGYGERRSGTITWIKNNLRIVIFATAAVIAALVLIIVFAVRHNRVTTVKIGAYTITAPAEYEAVEQEEKTDPLLGYTAHVKLLSKDDEKIFIQILEYERTLTKDDLNQHMSFAVSDGASLQETDISLGDFNGIWAVYDDDDFYGRKIFAVLTNEYPGLCRIELSKMEDPKAVLDKITIKRSK
ncbi:MAG: hypothetical protein K6G22_01130 [Lachnospiraceae bacterium]|nr:hypothetical protein [Lachnospiraceae bacterium]